MPSETAVSPTDIPTDTPPSQDTYATTEEAPTFPESEIVWDGYFESVGVLVLLLALLWLCFWAARKYGLFSMMPRAANIHRDALRLEGQLSIGPRKGIMVVRCLEKRLVLGVTDQNITLLTELAVENEAEENPSSQSSAPSQPASPSPQSSPTTPASAPDTKLVQTFNSLLQGKKS